MWFLRYFENSECDFTVHSFTIQFEKKAKANDIPVTSDIVPNWMLETDANKKGMAAKHERNVHTKYNVVDDHKQENRDKSFSSLLTFVEL